MAPSSVANSDPFRDPIRSISEHGGIGDSTLAVARNASLTLATDSLVVVGRIICAPCLPSFDKGSQQS